MRNLCIGLLLLSCLLWLSPAQATPPEVKERAQKAKSVNEVFAVLGVQTPELGLRILLEVPDISDGGTKIPVKIVSHIPGTDWIAVLVDRNLTPYVMDEEFSPGQERSVTLKVNLAQSSRIRAVVRASGKYYQVSRDVKVASEGCVTP